LITATEPASAPTSQPTSEAPPADAVAVADTPALDAIAAVSNAVTAPTESVAAEETDEYEDIWRPRRRVPRDRRPDQRRSGQEGKDRDRQEFRRRQQGKGDRRVGKPDGEGAESGRHASKERRGLEGRERRKDRREREDRPRIAATTESKRDGGIDPNSPFAALGRLKAELEKRAADDKS
jgi:ATP-dependent RNA helicase SUPV3L1/SUV3